MHSGHCSILGFFCRWTLSEESLKIVLCKWMTPSLLRLSEKCVYASVTMKKNHCMSMTDILWYNLPTNTKISSRMVTKPVLYLKSPFDLHYELFTVHGPWLSHFESSWSCMNWNMSPKICALRKLFFLIQPWYIHRQSDWRRHPCRMKGKWTNYPTCFALLDVSFMVILRRAGW